MKRRLRPILICALLAGGAVWVFRPRRAVIAKVETARASRAQVLRTVSASGKIQPFTTVDVKSKAGGTVIQMAVEEGSRVRRGQLICLIDRRDNLASLRSSQADVASARAALQSARANAGQSAAQLGPQIQQAQQAVAGGRARLQNARSALLQGRESARAGIAQSEAALRSAYSRLNSALEEARSQPDLTGASIASARAGLSSAGANFSSAQENLRGLLGATLPQTRASARATVQQAESNLQVAGRNLNRQQQLFDKGFVAQTALDAAQNQLDVARSTLENAQARLDTLAAEQEAQLRDARAKVEAARAGVASARAALTQAQANRVQDRLKSRAVDDAHAGVAQARATLDSARASARAAQQRAGDVSSEEANLRSAQAALQSAREGTGSVQARQADVLAQSAQLQKALQGQEQSARNLAQTTVVAPRDGIVLQKYVDRGAIIQSGESGFSGGTSIVQLADLGRRVVEAQVDEADIGAIAAGQTVRVTLDAYPNAPFSGRVRKVFPLAQAENNVTFVKVQVEILKSDPRLRPSLNTTCDFELQRSEGALSVPVDAVKEEGAKTFVTRVKDPNKAAGDPANQEKREVKLGTRGDERAQILSGLDEGDEVVLPKAETAPDAGGGGPFG